MLFVLLRVGLPFEWVLRGDERGNSMDIVDRLQRDRPSFHSGGAQRWDALPETLGYLGAHVHEGDHTLETGCGASTVVIAAGGAFHTVISPDVSEHELVREYCAKIGIATDRLTFVDGLSDDVLPELCKAGERFDLAFIDGAHGFPFPVVDWHYVSRMLRVDGCLVLDDIPIPSIAVAYRYMKSEPAWRVDSILDGRAAAVTLVSPVPPEDWTTQSFNDRADFSFLSPDARVKAAVHDRAHRLRRRLGRRYPALRRLRRSAG
jgi:predicted O-methyltransferase YrrM